jgi:glycosyltransferase involved in cell wall biosynthesis
MDLLVLDSKPRGGGLTLPPEALVVAMREPEGVDGSRKLDVLLNLPYYLRTMARHIRRADVVHTPVPGDMALLGLILALLMRKPVLARYGGAWNPTAQTTLMNRVTRTVMRLAARGRNVMIATGVGEDKPSHGVEWLFSSALSEAELNAVQPDLDRGLQQPAKLIYAGRLSEEKGVHDLVRAMSLLKGSGISPMPQLVIAGDGPERRRLCDLVQSFRLSNWIEFTGQLDRSQLSERFMMSDLAVQPSLTESFGKAWIDAMAHGLPVITCDVGSARPCIGADGERGWITPPGNAVRLSEAIRAALTENIDWPSMRRRYRSYSEQFTIEKWTGRIADLCAAKWSCRIVEGKLVHA